MSFRSVDRFERIDIQRMPVAELRRELTAVRSELRREANEVEQQLQKLERQRAAAVAEMGEVKDRLTRAEQQAVRAEERVSELQRTVDEATKARFAAEERARLVEARLGQTEVLEKRLVELEVDRTRLQAQLVARDKLIAELREKAPDERIREVKTGDIFSRFADAVDAAAASGAASGFDIDDVEVDVRGALGEADGELVLGLDAKRQTSSETATRLRFRLKRRAQLKQVE